MAGSESGPIAGPNPYVGPRPFEPGETLYGRDRELHELYYVFSGERILLLHSPSGAGKSSLVQAGLLPRLRERFDVWRPTRVNQEPPVAATGAVNRYVASAIQGLEEGIPEELRRPPEVLAGLSLAAYVESRPRRPSAPENVALIFDQFEEVLTVDPLAVEAKGEFFDQLGDLLRQPRVWALFVLREDFLAPLDPYALRVPTHLKNRFRIDLLGPDGAREAIVNPALEGGREFPAADELVHDLATMKVQQADGSFVEQTGHHVEPVQLQVVCRRLWDAMPEDELAIDAEDLAQFGDVTEALAGYYADSVTRIAAGESARERAIRDWFSQQLITRDNIRGQVLKGAAESEGLANEIIVQLLDTHLVRAEKRAGATWFELAHDRLIEPVQKNNFAWVAENLSEVQQLASLWECGSFTPGLLLTGEKLAEGERWAADNEAELTEIERRFLDESRQAQASAERERRQTRRIRRLGIAATIVGALALVAMVFAVLQMVEANEQRQEAVSQRQEADRQRDEAESQRQEADRQREEAENERRRAEEQREIAVAAKSLAEAKEREAQLEKERTELAREQEAAARGKAVQAQKEAVDQRQLAERQRAKAEEATNEAVRLRLAAEAEAIAARTMSMTGTAHRELAALLALHAYRLNVRFGGEEENPQLYNAMHLALSQLGSGRIEFMLGHRAAVRSLAVAPDGTLAFGSESGEIRRLDLNRADAGAAADEASLAGRFDDGVRALAFSFDGRLLAAGSFGGTVQVWENEKPRIVAAGGPTVHALAFRPGSSWLAAGDARGRIRLWNLDAAAGEATTLWRGEVAGGQAPGEQQRRPHHVRALAFSPSGVSLAASSGHEVLLWEAVEAGGEPRRLSAEGEVHSVAFSGDGRFLAGGTAQGAIMLWEPEKLGQPIRLLGHTAQVEGVAFHPRRNLLASGSFDGSLRLWDVGHPDALPLVLEGHEFWVWAVAFSLGGECLISGSGDATINVWTTSSEALAEEICWTVTRNLTQKEWNEYMPPEVEYEKTCPDLPGAPGP